MTNEGAYARRARRAVLAVSVILVGAVTALCFFTVDTSEYAVVTEFGEPVAVITTSGLHFKYPYQRVAKFDNRLFIHTPPLSEFLTLEKTSVVASSAILWRIDDPQKFLETVFNRIGAESRLSDILFAELGAAIGGAPLEAFISADPGVYRAEAIIAGVARRCREIALRDYGIAVTDIKLQRLDFPKRNRLAVYNRMKSERVRISMRFRSEGEEEGVKIRATAEQEKNRLLSEAFKVAQRHRGEGEARAARIYAESLGRAPEFYRFLRSREAAKVYLDEDTTLILPAESELFSLLYDSDHFNRSEQPRSDLAETPPKGGSIN
jgi:membrane protease subunit HflC